MKNVFLKIIIAILSAGWLLPFAFGLDCYMSFVERDLPWLSQGRGSYNSFPMMETSRLCMKVTAIWLAFVIIFWAFRLLKNDKPDHQS